MLYTYIFIVYIINLYIYNKTSIKRNILTIKKIHREVGRAKDLSAPQYIQGVTGGTDQTSGGCSLC